VKPRHAILAVAVLVAAGLNALNWNPQDVPDAAPKSTAAYSPADFRLKVGAAPAPAERSARDLFRPKLPPPAPPAPVVAAAPPPPPEPPPSPPPKSAREIAEEAARDELKQFRLVAVALRRGAWQAMVVKGDQVYMVHAGEKVGERFEVKAIAEDGIQLSDPASRVNGLIPVSGK
jgi:hypothetical protein